MKKLPIVLLATAFLWSCEGKQTVKTEESKASLDAVSSDSLLVVASSESGSTQVVNEATSAQSAPVANAGQKPALNPPHGEPYHRCDIEVGAPIDSPAPVQNAAPTAVGTPAQNSFNTNPIQPGAAPATSVTSTAVGPKPALNPPHGQPHHRCDLQVGAPLT